MESQTLAGYAAGTVHAVKWISFLGQWRPILCQNENGPCPLIAISNCLLLLGRFSVDPKFKYVDNSWIIEQVNNYITAANRPRDVGSELWENMKQLLSDVKRLLPNLQHGMDVNVRFGDCEGFEFTPELSVYDLTGLRLVHGWVVPEEDMCADVLSELTYNAAQDKVINATAAQSLKDARPAATHAPSPSKGTSSFRFSAKGLAALSSPHSASGVGAGGAGRDVEGVSSPSGLMRRHTPAHSAVAVIAVDALPSPSPVAPSQVPQAEVGDGAIAVLTSSAPAAPGNEEMVEGESELPSHPPIDGTTTGVVAVGDDNTPEGVVAVGAPVTLALGGGGGGEATHEDDAMADTEAPPQDHSDAAAPAAVGTADHDSQQSDDFEAALLIQTFLTRTASQLTHAGLAQIYNRLSDREVAVFFRNNHFSTIFKQGGKLLLLASDEGYRDVPEIVWEQLDDVGGDNTLLDAEFNPPGHIRSQQFVMESSSSVSASEPHGEAHTGVPPSSSATHEGSGGVPSASSTLADHQGSAIELPSDFNDLPEEEKRILAQVLAASAAPQPVEVYGGGGGGDKSDGPGRGGAQMPPPVTRTHPQAAQPSYTHIPLPTQPHPHPGTGTGRTASAPAVTTAPQAAPGPVVGRNDVYGHQAASLRQAAAARETRRGGSAGGSGHTRTDSELAADMHRAEVHAKRMEDQGWRQDEHGQWYDPTDNKKHCIVQ